MVTLDNRRCALRYCATVDFVPAATKLPSDMCGRAAQTNAIVSAAASALGYSNSFRNDSRNEDAGTNVPPSIDCHLSLCNVSDDDDNFNMSPGMRAWVFWKENGVLKMGQKVWGIIPRHGTTASPLPTGMNHHFTNLMYNARTDTLFEKPTFARLAKSGKSCVVALNGFFEWKSQGAGRSNAKKQPYFVYRRKEKKARKETGVSVTKPYLFFAGLWSSVRTGRPEDHTLETFALLTQDSCPSFAWLHHRMPVSVWDTTLIHEWLNRPSPRTLSLLENANRRCEALDWHAVTTEMSSLKFRSKAALKAIPERKSVMSFFVEAASKDSSPLKRPVTDSGGVQSDRKKPRLSPSKRAPSRRDIRSYFSPKSLR